MKSYFDSLKNICKSNVVMKFLQLIFYGDNKHMKTNETRIGSGNRN